MNTEESSNKVAKKYDNYSKFDGTMYLKNKTNNLTMRMIKRNNCPKCENKIERYRLYCEKCGHSLEDITKNNLNFIDSEGEKTKFKDILTTFNIKKAFMTSFIAILILFVISTILKITLIGSNNQISQLINPIHILLLSNLGNIDIYISSFMNSSSSNLSLGFLILLILPVISLVISYRFFMKNENTSLPKHIKNSIGVGITYGIILSILAKVSQEGLNLSDGFNSYVYRMYYGFSMLSVLFKGFTIGFMSVLFLGLKKEYEKDNKFISIVKLAFKTIIIGYIITFVILIIMYLINIDYIYELGLSSYKSQINIGVILSQLAMYLWSFSNLIPINIGEISISSLSLFNSTMSLDLILMLGSILALSALVFIIVGCKLDLKYKKEEGIKPVVIFSTFYSVIMGIIAIFTSIDIGNNAASIIGSISTVQMGFNFILTIVISFIYTLLTTLIGFKLNIFN